MPMQRFGSSYYDADYFCTRGVKGWYDKSAFAINNPFHNDIAKLVIDILNIGKGKNLIELGCALGNVVYHLAQKYGIDAYGVDISEFAVKNSHCPDRIKQADIIEHIPYPGDMFDYAFSRETLEHIHERHLPGALKELFRVMKPDGTALLCPANDICGKESKKQHDEVNADISHLCIQPIYWWERMLESVGFEVNYRQTNYAMSLPPAEKFGWTMIVVRKPNGKIK